MLNGIPDIRPSGHRNQKLWLSEQTDELANTNKLKTRNPLVWGEIFTQRESNYIEVFIGIRIRWFELSRYHLWPYLDFSIPFIPF